MLKDNEKKELLKADRIELVKINQVKGFKKDEVETIVNELIKAYNLINDENYMEEFTIKVNTFKLTTIYKKSNIINCLDRFKAKVKNAEKEENTTLEKMKKIFFPNQLIKTQDGFITDGCIALKDEIIGTIPENEKFNENCITKIESLFENELIKIDNYKKSKKGDIFLLYKDLKNYKAFEKSYVELLPKDCDLYLGNAKNVKGHVLVAIKDKKIIGLILGYLAEVETIKKDFPFVPSENEILKDEIINLSDVIELSKVADDNRHYNFATHRYYHGNNAIELDKAVLKNNYKCTLWVGSGQAKKLNKQVKADAKGVTIRIYYEDESGRSFCKLETIYNVEELEPIQKVENTSDYKSMIERLKRA